MTAAGFRIGGECEPCATSVDAPDSGFGRALVEAFNDAHKPCKPTCQCAQLSEYLSADVDGWHCQNDGCGLKVSRERLDAGR